MKMKYVSAFLSAAGMMALILDGQTALLGASRGLELCLKAVIPALFPFLFLCSILVNSLWGSSLAWLGPLRQVLGIPKGAESMFLAALLGGYPAGAQQIGEAFRTGKLTKEDAQHLLTFCSNAGPAFLFGITAMQFPGQCWVWALWGIHALSALITGRLSASRCQTAATLTGKGSSIAQTLITTVKTMGTICGWILLFQILLAFLDRWMFWCFPEWVQVLLTGLLELSSGCSILKEIQHVELRFLVCGGILSLGGLCVAMQTAAVTAGLSMKPYLLGKLTQTIISMVLSVLYLRFGWMAFLSAALLFPVGQKKRSGFLGAAGV